MNDIFTSPNNSDSTFGPKYWCQTCQRHFSYIRTESDSSQTHCPQCNGNVEELPSINRQPTVSQPGQQQSQSQSQPQSQPQSQSQFFTEQPNDQQDDESIPPRQPRRREIYITRTFIDPLAGRVFIQVTPIRSERNTTNTETENNQDGQQENQQENQQERRNPLDSLLSIINDMPLFVLFGLGGNSSNESFLEAFLRNDPNKNGPLPASQDSIEQLKEVKLEESCSGADSCPICYEDYREDDTLVQLSCRHEYHKGCASKWLGQHNSCPMCRQQI